MTGTPSLYSTISRHAILDELRASTARVVTLVGSAGVGKSWIAAHHAARREAAVIDLAIQRTIDCPPGVTTIVLDNVDHARGAAIDRAVTSTARLVVTSREPLRVPGEHVIAVSPLGVPDPGESEIDRVLASEAGQLLAARVPAAELAHADAALVTEILIELDGNPLAIELASARVHVLGLRQLKRRLARRFEVLGTPSATGRHGSQWAAIEWSWTLLSEHERVALAQCSTFQGRFSLDAAEAVLELGPGAPPVLDVLQRLVDRSLVHASAVEATRGERRFVLENAMRAFAAIQLARLPAHAGIQARHASYFQLARWMDDADATRDSIGLRDRLALDVEDLTAACETSVANPGLLEVLASRRLGTLDRMERLISRQVRFGPFWLLRRSFARAVSLAVAGPDDAAQRTALFSALGGAAATAGQIALAHRLFDRAFAEADRASREDRGFALFAYGSSPVAGDTDARRGALIDALAIARETASDSLAAGVLAQLGCSYLDEAMPEEAITYFDAALDHTTERSRRERLLVLASRAAARQEVERFAQAREDLEVACALVDPEHRRDALGLLVYLAILDWETGALDRAADQLREAIAGLGAIGARALETVARAFAGACDAQRGKLADARISLDAAALAARTFGAPDTANLVEILRAFLYVADADAAVRARAIAMARGSTGHVDERTARRLLRRMLADDSMVVAGDGTWFRHAGREVALARRPVLANLVAALARESPLSSARLIEAGWPGQQITASAATNRLHVALTTLRNLGFRDFLVREGDCYRLAPCVTINAQE